MLPQKKKEKTKTRTPHPGRREKGGLCLGGPQQKTTAPATTKLNNTAFKRGGKTLPTNGGYKINTSPREESWGWGGGGGTVGDPPGMRKKQRGWGGGFGRPQKHKTVVARRVGGRSHTIKDGGGVGTIGGTAIRDQGQMTTTGGGG